jgi:hypothetical protein
VVATVSGKLTRYLRQTCIWGRATGIDAYGKRSYEETTLRCRAEKRSRLTKDKTGREVVSIATFFIEVPDGIVSSDEMMGDTMDSHDIITVIDMVGADGKLVGFEVLV